MRLAVFADESRYEQMNQLCENADIASRVESVVFYSTYDDFIMNLPRSGCTSVVVAHRGATGMQAVRAAKILMHRVPVVWFSDDSAFVEESYQLKCAFFSPGLITEELLNAALNRCQKAIESREKH